MPPHLSRVVFPAAALLAALSMAGFIFLEARLQALPDIAGDRVACLSYSPYRGTETPFDESFSIPPTRIDADLALLAAHARCVRTYTVGRGLDHIVAAARRSGLVVYLGAWIGRDPARNRRELARALALANANDDVVRLLIVGNETLLRGENAPETLAAYLDDARRATRVPVTYADVWEFWLKNPTLADHVDVVTVHILPYWEDEPIGSDRAVDHVLSIHDRVRAAFADKPVLIGETGWPSAGRAREDAVPGRANQAAFIRRFVARAGEAGISYNLIEAFDQPWKRMLEGTVGGAWGLYDDARRWKFPLSGPVADVPFALPWLAFSAAAGAAAALALSRGAGVAARIVLAGMGFAGGGALFHFGAFALEAGRTALESAGYAAIAGGSALATILTARALAHLAGAGREGVPGLIPSSETVLVWLRDPGRGAMTAALGLSALRLFLAAGALSLTLALLFDGRYRDFPVTGFAVPAFGFLTLRLVGRVAPPGPTDRLLGVAVVLSGALLLVLETPANIDALGWFGVCLALGSGLAGVGRGRGILLPSQDDQPQR